MKKKLIGISALSAALAISAAMPAFAGWFKDGDQWAYEYADGSRPKNASWFTDPDTKLEYYLDPDGHMMSGTTIEGFWLDDNGVKQEKSESQLALEEERRQRNANRNTPAKEQSLAKEAADKAKTTSMAASTTRFTYQTEMKALMDVIYIDTLKKINELGNSSVTRDIVENNLQTTYGFKAENRGIVINTTLWKSSNTKSVNYVPHVLEMSYNRSVPSTDEEAALFNDSFKRLLVASLGENQGNAVYERIFAEEVGNGAKFDVSGNTDTGNMYELSYRNNSASLTVTCSEIVPTPEEETAAGDETSENATDENAEGASGENTENAADGNAEGASGENTGTGASE